MNKQYKVCKQCGRMLRIDAYRKYVSRSKGKYETTTGHHTVCRECENFNQQVNNAYSKPAEMRSNAQELLLDKAKHLYEELHRRGLEPKGRYAVEVLGLNNKTGKLGAADSYIASVLNGNSGRGGKGKDKDLQERGHELLEMELTQEPEVYQDLVDTWREEIVGPDGRVSAEYLDLFNAVAERIDTYEDNYTW